MRYYAIAILLLLTIGIGTAQSIFKEIEKLDPSKNKYSFAILRRNVKEAKTDLEKAHALNELAEFHNNSFEKSINGDSAKFYAIQAQQISQKLIKKGIGAAHYEALLSRQLIALAAHRKSAPKDSVKVLFYSIKRAAIKQNDLKNLADAYNNLGILSSVSDSSISYFRKAIRIADSIGFSKVAAYSAKNLSSIVKSRNEKQHLTKVSLQAAYSYCNFGYVAQILTNKGKLLLSNSKEDSALICYNYAIELLGNLGFNSKKASLLNAIGDNYYYLGRLKQSIPCYLKADSIAKLFNDIDTRASANNNLAISYYEMANYPTSLKYYLRALPLSKLAGDDFLYAGILHNIGDLYASLSRYELSVKYLKKALDENTRQGNVKWQGYNNYSLADVYLTQKKYLLALERARKALQLSKTIGLSSPGSDTLLIGRCHFKLRNYQKAYTCFLGAEKFAYSTNK